MLCSRHYVANLGLLACTMIWVVGIPLSVQRFQPLGLYFYLFNGTSHISAQSPSNVKRKERKKTSFYSKCQAREDSPEIKEKYHLQTTDLGKMCQMRNSAPKRDYKRKYIKQQDAPTTRYHA